MKSICSILILTLSGALASAQSVFDVTLKNVMTDQSITLREYNVSKGVVIVFMSAKCPYAKYYENRLHNMVEDYRDKEMPFVIINSNGFESTEMMKSQAVKLNTTYLLDESKQLANVLGAKKSPEAFVLKNDGTNYYSGAIDDNPQVATDIKITYLKDAIDALLAGKSTPQDKGRPVGCMIK